jgi:hypothetical protein
MGLLVFPSRWTVLQLPLQVPRTEHAFRWVLDRVLDRLEMKRMQVECTDIDIHVHCREIVTLLTKRALIGLHCCFGIQLPAKTGHIDNALATFGVGGIGSVLRVCKE